MTGGAALSQDIKALSLRVAKAELELRLLNALIRITIADQALAAQRTRTEESIGIYRDHENMPAWAAP